MSNKKHNFSFRFYSGNYEKNNSDLRALVKYFKDDAMPVTNIGNYARRVCIYADNSKFDNSISGYFTTYRDDIYHKGNKKTGKEELLQLSDDESIIERNYFIFFYGKTQDVLIYQNSSLLGNIKNFSSYLTNLTQFLPSLNGNFSSIEMLEIGAEKFVPSSTSPPITQIEYKLANPKRKKPRVGENPWIQEQFDEMNSLGISSQKVLLTNRSRKGLSKKIWNIVTTLLTNDQTKTLKISLQNIEQPIDLLNNILKDKFSITAVSRKEVDPKEIFNRIRELKEKHKNILHEYIDE